MRGGRFFTAAPLLRSPVYHAIDGISRIGVRRPLSQRRYESFQVSPESIGAIPMVLPDR
jgi:hypothetical protein